MLDAQKIILLLTFCGAQRHSAQVEYRTAGGQVRHEANWIPHDERPARVVAALVVSGEKIRRQKLAIKTLLSHILAAEDMVKNSFRAT